MKFRLKDIKRQKALDASSETNRFSEMLQTACEQQMSNQRGYVNVDFGEKISNFVLQCFSTSIKIPKSDIEEVHEYDPHRWNEYPEVTPPTGVWMRCEFTTAEGELLRFCARFDVCWCNRYREKVSVRRFRPWEEEE